MKLDQQNPSESAVLGRKETLTGEKRKSKVLLVTCDYGTVSSHIQRIHCLILTLGFFFKA